MNTKYLHLVFFFSVSNQNPYFCDIRKGIEFTAGFFVVSSVGKEMSVIEMVMLIHLRKHSQVIPILFFFKKKF